MWGLNVFAESVRWTWYMPGRYKSTAWTGRCNIWNDYVHGWEKIVLTENLLKASLLLFVQLWYNGRNYKGRKRVPRITSSFMHYALCMYTHSQHPSWPQLCRLVPIGTQAIRSGSHHLKKTNYIAKKTFGRVTS